MTKADLGADQTNGLQQIQGANAGDPCRRGWSKLFSTDISSSARK
jgi:hypothetical protein